LIRARVLSPTQYGRASSPVGNGCNPEIRYDASAMRYYGFNDALAGHGALTAWRKSPVVILVTEGATGYSRSLTSCPVIIGCLAIPADMGIGLCDDVLNRVQRAQDLHETDVRMDLTTEAVDMGVWIRNIRNKQVRSSKVWLCLSGCASPIRYTPKSGFTSRWT